MLNTATTLNPTAVRANLFKAKSLEHTDEKAALTVYAGLAKHGIPEAQYRYGLMLLEGRGTKRQFCESFRFLQYAYLAKHPEAQRTFSQIDQRMAQLTHIAIHWEKLNIPDCRQMSLPLQSCILPAIMIDKDESSPIEKNTITYCDYTTVLDDLDDIFADIDRFLVDMDCSAETVPQKYRQLDPALLLFDCLGRWNDELRTSVGVMTQECWLPEKTWAYLGEHLSVEASIQLSATSKSHYLRHKANPLLQRRLRYHYIETMAKSPCFLEFKTILEDVWMKDRFVEEDIRFDQLHVIVGPLKDALMNSEVQGWLDQRPPYYLDEILHLSEAAAHFLAASDWVRECIDHKIFNFYQLNGMTTGGLHAIGSRRVRSWLVDRPDYVNPVFGLSMCGASALRQCAEIMDRIDKRAVTFEHLNGITEEKSVFLTNPKIRRKIVKDPQIIDRILTNTWGHLRWDQPGTTYVFY